MTTELWRQKAAFHHFCHAHERSKGHCHHVTHARGWNQVSFDGPRGCSQVLLHVGIYLRCSGILRMSKLEKTHQAMHRSFINCISVWNSCTAMTKPFSKGQSFLERGGPKAVASLSLHPGDEYFSEKAFCFHQLIFDEKSHESHEYNESWCSAKTCFVSTRESLRLTAATRRCKASSASQNKSKHQTRNTSKCHETSWNIRFNIYELYETQTTLDVVLWDIEIS